MSTAKVYTLTENESDHAKSVIDEICKFNGETFAQDPHFQEVLAEPIDVKVDFMIRSQINAAHDPNFFIMYLVDEDDAAATTDNAKGLGSIKVSAALNTGRDDKGLCNTWRAFILAVLYGLPYIFRWGISDFISYVRTAWSGVMICPWLAEIAQHLGVKLTDCYVLEYLSGRLGQIGKGYGPQLMKAVFAKADADKKHVVYYSSTKKNVSFYHRIGCETYRDAGDGNCTLMFRRCGGPQN